MVNLPTFRQLEHLVLLADHGHFGRAAKACHVTQSTLSASIKELEKILQASLVDRTKRRVLLTPLGLDIVERARRILLEGKELVETARAESEPLSGTLRMGVISTVGPFFDIPVRRGSTITIRSRSTTSRRGSRCSRPEPARHGGRQTAVPQAPQEAGSSPSCAHHRQAEELRRCQAGDHARGRASAAQGPQ